MNANEIFEVLNEMVGEDKLMVLILNNMLLMMLGEKALNEDLFTEEEFLSALSDIKERANKFMEKLEMMKD